MITNSTKKNLRRNIEKSFKKNLKFITFDRKLFISPETMTVAMVILDLLKEKNELSNISKIADCIRKEIKEMKDQMPWPQQSSDLELEKFEMPPKLGQFLKTKNK